MKSVAGRTARKRRAERAGRIAETVAALHLTLSGYRVLARRFRTPKGEIDLVARRGRTLVFVEVKARAELDDALAALTPLSFARVAAAADIFRAARPNLAALDMRYDGVAIAGLRLKRVRDAWRPPS